MADLQEIEEVVSLVEAVDVSSPTKDLEPDLQNSVKNQLLLQALPPYVPPETPNQHYSSDQFFSCRDCGDKFLLESSLLHHIERRSVSILYGCRACAQTVLFYNRCALLAHLRGHQVEPDDDVASENIHISQEKMTLGPFSVMNEDDDDVELESDAVSLSPLPKNKIQLGLFTPVLMDGCGHLIHEENSQKQMSEEGVPNINNQVVPQEKESRELTDSDSSHQPGSEDKVQQSEVLDDITSNHSIINDEKSESSNTKDDNQESDDVLLIPVPDISSDDITHDSKLAGSLECKECGIVPQNGDMKDHFLCSDLPVDLQFKCKVCNLILPSSCSFSAHKRIHSQTKPYICPECSHEFRLWAPLSVHMQNTCFHMSKAVHYRCMQCKCLFPTAVSLEVHLLKQHVKSVYKCSACPIACFSANILQDHKIKTHGQASLVTRSYQLCQLCPHQLIPKTRLLFHVNEHSKEQSVRLYVYQCSNCSFFAQRKIAFATHRASCLQREKLKLAKVSSPTNPNKVLATHNVMIPPGGKQANVVIPPGSKQANVVIPPGSKQSNNMNPPGSKQANIMIPPGSKQANIMIPPGTKKQANVMIPPGSKQANNFVKIIYTVPQSQMQLALLPAASVKTVKTVMLPQPQLRKILPKADVKPQEIKNSLVLIKKITPTEEKKVHKDSSDQGENKCIYVNDSKCEPAAEKTDAFLSAMESENFSLSLQNMDSTKPDTAAKSENILRLCSSCSKELNLFLQGLSASKFPEFCAKCAKENAFLKEGGKFLLFPYNKITESQKVGIKNTNGRIELTSTTEVTEQTLSTIKNSGIKRNANALNGPASIKKLKTSTAVSVESNKYRCHLCRMLISMDWFKIEEHFASKHPSFKLLLLSPKVTKLQLNCTNVRMPFSVKDHETYPEIKLPKKGSPEPSMTNITGANGNEVDDYISEDHDFNESCMNEKFNNTDNEERNNSRESGGFTENAYYIKTERDIPIDYDLLPAKLKRKKKSSHKASDRADKEGGANIPFNSGQIVPAAQEVLASGHKYECSKCHYVDSCVESFHEHIKLHHTDKSAFQCMECGMCFVVKPSFEKHLFVSHRIKDVEGYLQNNNCCVNSGKGEETEDMSQDKGVKPASEDFPPDLVENQCRVCREIFDSAFQLNKHFRTHETVEVAGT